MGRQAIRGVVCAGAFVVLARPAPATACSHPFACSPQLVYPAGGVAVPTNAQVVVQIESTCIADPVVEIRRVSDGAVIAATSERTVGAFEDSIVDDYIVTDGLRVTPDAALDPDTSYEVWATDSSGSLPPDHTIGSFTTGAGPYVAEPPPAPAITLTAGAPSSTSGGTCGEVALCCGPTTLQAIAFTAADPDLLYTLTADDGSVIASDLPATSTGVAVCAGNSYVEAAAGRLWIARGTGDVTIHVVGRDVLGRATPEVTQTITLCPPITPEPDANPGDAAGGGGGGGGGGCSAGGDAPGLVLIALGLAAAAITRRNPRR